MLFGNKKEWNTDTCYSLDESSKIYAKWKPEHAKDHILYNSLYMKWPERGHQYSHTEAIPRFPSRLLESSVWWVCPCVPLSCSQMFKLQFRLLSQGGTNIPPLPDFSSMAQSCLTLCDPMDCSMPGFPVYHQLLELAQTHVHRVGDAIQPSHPLSSPSPPAFYLSQHQGLFQRVSSLHQMVKVLELQLKQWIFRTDFL